MWKLFSFLMSISAVVYADIRYVKQTVNVQLQDNSEAVNEWVNATFNDSTEQIGTVLMDELRIKINISQWYSTTFSFVGLVSEAIDYGIMPDFTGMRY